MMIIKIIPALVFFTVPAMAVYAQAPVSSTQQGGGSTEQRLERVERMLDSQGLLDMLQQLQQLQREISLLRGEIETQNYNLDQLTRRQRDLYTDVDQRMQRLERGAGFAVDTDLGMIETGMADGPPLETLSPIQAYSDSPSGIVSGSPLQIEFIGSETSSGTTGGPEAERIPDISVSTDIDPLTGGQTSTEIEPTPTIVGPLTVAQSTPADPVQLQAEYQQAFNLLRQSLYDQAIRAFQQFLASHPDALFSDNAQYWLAEAHYVKREFPQALAEYNKVVTDYPQSQKVNDALLKIGFTLFEMGELDAASKQLQELIQKQPDTTVARLADERLKRISTMSQQTSPVPLAP